MAKRAASEAEEPEVMSLEDLQRVQAKLQMEILETQLETQKLQLEEAREKNLEYQSRKRQRKLTTTQMQEELAKRRNGNIATVRICRHKQGGKPDQRFKGTGASALHMTQMLDGKTMLIQCLRCPLAVMTPHPSIKKENPELYAKLMEEFQELSEQCEEAGMDPVKVPSFSFTQNDIPMLPKFEYEYRGKVVEAYA
jgi:hypothetical protein